MEKKMLEMVTDMKKDVKTVNTNLTNIEKQLKVMVKAKVKTGS